MISCLLGGIWGFVSLGRLEDPAFTIKQATVITLYPGASAAEVAKEISEPLEAEIQGMAEVDTLTSTNRPGVSLIQVDIKSTVGPEKLPDVWAKLRHRVGDISGSLPSGARSPIVNDTFGDVYGIFFAVTAEGFRDKEIHDIATFLQRELLAVSGVASVELAGLPSEAIFVEPILPIAVSQGVPPNAIASAISVSDSLVDAGAARRAGARQLLRGPAGRDSVAGIGGLSIGVSGRVVKLYDFAKVYRGREARPSQIIRFNGKEAFTLGVAGISTENIVDVGKRIDARLSELRSEIPVGVKIHPIYQQHKVVETASNDFLVNLAMSVAIVVIVLALFMGWRAAVVVGVTLALTVIGTLFFMGIFSIEMERISLGALIIAMGMLVDNSIVVAEGMQMLMLSGKSSRDAAQEVGGKTQMPLLGATVIGVMAFAGIGLSPDSTGEFLFSLFAVIGISLMLSWALAITVTPLLAHYVFARRNTAAADLYSGALYRGYGAVLKRTLQMRGPVTAALIAVTLVCFYGFGLVKQSFFPDSNTPLLFAHAKLKQGTEIDITAKEMRAVEEWLRKRKEVESVSTFVGEGAARFMLTYSGKFPNPSYGHLIIRVKSVDQIAALKADLDAFAATRTTIPEFRTERLKFGPSTAAPIQARFSGPDPTVLRALAEEAAAAMKKANPRLEHIRTDWREQELSIAPIYASDRAETAGVTREDIARTLKFATDGIMAARLREADRLIPIFVRQDPKAKIGLGDQVIYSSVASAFLPLAQVTNGFKAEPVDTIVMRRDRLLTITVSASIPSDETAEAMRKPIAEAIESIKLPLGYRMEWGGEFESSRDAQSSLATQLPLSLLIMVLISIFLFGALRQPLVIWLLVPMSINGVVIGLLATGQPFTFTALLGLLSLSGMLIKNGIVLVEEIDLKREAGLTFDRAILEASVSRLRPIVLAAATTILGMAPLLWDAFFVSMAVTIMGGLAFATILTLIAAPLLYSMIVSRRA
ncbi:MAG: efflux RND transporter permease subunit [Neomegalonema sp.]|nr:efflux RND transporter permease subunit [Neomegalonema sp.]